MDSAREAEPRMLPFPGRAWERGIAGRRDNHRRRSQHAIVQHEALLQHLHDLAGSVVVSRLLHHGLVQVRVEVGAGRAVDHLDSVASENVKDLRNRRGHAHCQRAGVAGRFRDLQSAIEIVERREEVSGERLGR